MNMVVQAFCKGFWLIEKTSTFTLNCNMKWMLQFPLNGKLIVNFGNLSFHMYENDV